MVYDKIANICRGIGKIQFFLGGGGRGGSVYAGSNEKSHFGLQVLGKLIFISLLARVLKIFIRILLISNSTIFS